MPNLLKIVLDKATFLSYNTTPAEEGTRNSSLLDLFFLSILLHFFSTGIAIFEHFHHPKTSSFTAEAFKTKETFHIYFPDNRDLKTKCKIILKSQTVV